MALSELEIEPAENLEEQRQEIGVSLVKKTDQGTGSRPSEQNQVNITTITPQLSRNRRAHTTGKRKRPKYNTTFNESLEN